MKTTIEYANCCERDYGDEMSKILKKFPFMRPPCYFSNGDYPPGVKISCDDHSDPGFDRESGVGLRTERIVNAFSRYKNKDLKPLWSEIRKAGLEALKEGGFNWLKRRIAWALIERRISPHKDIFALEEDLKRLLNREVDQSVRINKLTERANQIFRRIKPFVKGHYVFDYGSGDTLLAKVFMENGFKTVACDVVDYRLPSARQVPFFVCNKNGVGLKEGLEKLNSEKPSTTILYTVLHHTNNPLKVLEAAVENTKERLIIVEGYVDTPKHYAFNVFYDWFLNRVLKDADIYVPANYLVTEGWLKTFEYYGLETVYVSEPEITEKVAPEYHIMFVVDKINK